MRKIRLNILLLLSVISLGVLFHSCDDDYYDNGPDARWYLTGTWQCMQYPNETLTFYSSGSGEWDDNATGSYMEFNYYCDGNLLWFDWFPVNGPSYSEDCTIYVTNDNAMQIIYPPRAGYGPTTLYYARIN